MPNKYQTSRLASAYPQIGMGMNLKTEEQNQPKVLEMFGECAFTEHQFLSSEPAQLWPKIVLLSLFMSIPTPKSHSGSEDRGLNYVLLFRQIPPRSV